MGKHPSKMDDLGGEDTSFIADEVREMIREVCDSVIKKETMFDQSHIEEHTAAVIEEALKRLADQRKPFKYVVTCAITQRAGMGIHMATSTHWDPNHDGQCCTCIATVDSKRTTRPAPTFTHPRLCRCPNSACSSL